MARGMPFGRGRGKATVWRGGRNNFRGRGRGSANGKDDNRANLQTEETVKETSKFEYVQLRDEIDDDLGFPRFSEGPPKTGWLINMHPTIVKEDDNSSPKAAVDYYFIQEDGAMFKATITYEPYFMIACKKGFESHVEEWLNRRFEGLITRLERHRKEDLKLPNHLLGHRRTFIQLVFRNVEDLLAVRREILPIANKNKDKMDAVDAYAEVVGSGFEGNNKMDVDLDPLLITSSINANANSKSSSSTLDPSEYIIDIREYDVTYYLRVAIDKDIRVGKWYTVTVDSEGTDFKCLEELVERPDPVVMAFDIETSKAPLKFPDAEHDQIMMISYMIDGQGFLITNREIVSEDIDDFEYTPKPDFEGPFTIFNEADEKAVIRRFFDHVREARPTVIATYNGDSFDFPFVCTRAAKHGMDMLKEIGFTKDQEGEFKSRHCTHMDCFRWVKRDSYLPQGSQGLKAVTVAKLGYDPLELDPELMTPYAIEQPQILAQYSVSDAVATYYLYMQYVHPFIFSLCNIIPLNPDEVLRKGTGTLCETLLMVEAYKGEIIMPNRHVDPQATMFEGHLLESETYVGGHVEALEAGVFRSDIPTEFRIAPSAIQQLIDQLDAALKFSIVEEGKTPLDQVEDYDEVKQQIVDALNELKKTPLRHDKPLIYHLDVAAMYPNIMLSNRLQPDAAVTEATCAACDYNRPGKNCDRRMTWAWRGEFFPAKLDEYRMVRNALEQETFPPKYGNGPPRSFTDLSTTEQTSLVHKRLGDYSRKVYHKVHDTKIVYKETIICQRENPFYIDTVRNFRDRRYVYKGLHKKWKKKSDEAQEKGSLSETVEAKKMIVLYDSLQLAHKCILNSFYGYVMRKGARWHSMEMAGITCLTGASIIQMARQLVEQIGRPLELDTDGIWCMLPGSFPDNYSFTLKNGKKFPISYPCTMLNHLVHDQFTNHQYHEITDPTTGACNIKSENSIFFELDGPYRAMILPSSKEEDKLLKKRYAVFNEDGSLAELKGFEVKRRGELQLIKIFQSQLFERFLLGHDLETCYAEVAATANQWLDVLFTKAKSLHDDELVELIAENRSMSKTLAEYQGQKSTSISTARRLAEFLGENMTKDKGLACKFIISAKPFGAPVTERAVPVAIFSAEESVKQTYLRKWLKDNSLTDFTLRGILDWDYYIERMGSVVQKLITIPAAMQKVSNPVPRIRHPDWLLRRVANLEDRFRQHKLVDLFTKQKQTNEGLQDKSNGNGANDDGVNDDNNDEAVALELQRKALLEEHMKKTGANKKKKSSSAKERNVDENAPIPDINVDFPGWLRAMRPIWRRQRQERKSRPEGQQSGPKGSLGNIFRQQALSLSSHAWDIVQVQPIPNRPGEFKTWLFISGRFQSVRLKIPRVFYLDVHNSEKVHFPETCLVEESFKTLPRSQRSKSLFKVTVDEFDYVADASDYSFLIDQPEVLGAYETQVPLFARALIKLGATCKIRHGSGTTLSKGLDRGFILDDLVSDDDRKGISYLENGIHFNYVYLYHANLDTRHILTIIQPDSKARIIIVDPSNNRQVPNLKTYYQEQLDRRRKNEATRHLSGVFEYFNDMEVSINFTANVDAAFRSASKELNSIFSSKGGTTMLITCFARELDYYEERFGKSLSQFPRTQVHLSRADDTFRTLGWQEKTAKRMLQHYLRVSIWMKNRIMMAGTYGIPVCNLGRDVQMFAADLDFSRRLTSSDMLLWWSPGSRPDLGGKEADANLQQLSEDLINPEISKPGCYSNASVELELRDLAINSIIQSAYVYEVEGTDGGASLGFTETSHNLDEYSKGTAHADVVMGEATLTSQTLGILKTMVRSWVIDGSKNDGRDYRILAEHFWRWISSPGSALFDPAMHRFVHGLMRKTFSQLVAELRRLGSEVVYGDFNRLILLTNKPSSTAAYAYIKYIASSVNSRELFKLTSLEIVQFFEYLIWMDPANQAMIINPDPEVISMNKDSNEPEDININFNLSTTLPLALQDEFDSAVAEFLVGLRQAHLACSSDFRTPLKVLQNANETAQDPEKKKESDMCKDFVSQKYTRLMLRLVEKVTRDYAEVNEEGVKDWEFPTLPGSLIDRSKANPVLEFIKTVCGVLSLSRDLVLEVQILKRNLVELIGVREFASEAVFKNPCASFKLPTRVCQHCTASRDFDLVNDPDIAQSTRSTRRPTWTCLKCENAFDMNMIEATMVEMAHRLVNSAQLQDLKCSRCNRIKATNLSTYCQCSGPYMTIVSKDEALQRLRIMLAISDFHNLNMVKEAVQEIIGHL